ncbi:N-acetylmuramyl-L-alanine amidase, negative regulator of AmpC, AmpD [Acetivibrio thermocellus BC1]|nr:N-acetylmuramyl-L-alanine amidase, negative regulator of AmpC, AmpD [Acetivibrio thermocellus BC1]
MDLKAWAQQNIQFVGNSYTNKSSRNQRIPEIIVNHISEGSMSSMISWFTSPNNKVSSAHFGVSKTGKIYQFVAIEDCAWANGLTSGIENATAELVLKKGESENPNWYSVSIEHEGVWSETKGALTPEQLEATKMLHLYIIEYVKEKYGHEIVPSRKTIIGHNEIDKSQRANCPGELFPYREIIDFLTYYGLPFKDIKGHWAEDLIVSAYEQGIIKGYHDGTFRPDAPMSRAEGVALAMAVLNKLKK